MVQILGKDVGEIGFGLMGMHLNHNISAMTNTHQVSRGAIQPQSPLKKPSQP